MKPILISALFAVVAFFLAASRINHGLVGTLAARRSQVWTLDEPFYISQGVYLFESYCDYGPLLFTPSGAQDVFGVDGYLPDHPPLSRLILGTAHQLTSWAVPGSKETIFNVPAARLGSCFSLAMIVFLWCEFARRRFGIATAVSSAVVLVLMPRVVGHARLAALESVTSLAWLVAILPLLSWWTGDNPPSLKRCLISGLLWGVLMLTKIQGILLPPVIVIWALWHFRFKAIVPLAVWGLTGLAIFFFGWPWLWLDAQKRH